MDSQNLKVSENGTLVFDGKGECDRSQKHLPRLFKQHVPRR